VLLTNFKLEGIGTSHIYQESIVMRGLQFAFKFQALSTQEIEATSSDYTVFMTGNQQKSIRQLPLTIKLFPEQIKLEALSAESRGYLNRLAKRAHIVQQTLCRTAVSMFTDKSLTFSNLCLPSKCH
jgi:hypothetical protein